MCYVGLERGAGTRKPLEAHGPLVDRRQPVQFRVQTSGPTPPPALQGGFWFFSLYIMVLHITFRSNNEQLIITKQKNGSFHKNMELLFYSVLSKRLKQITEIFLLHVKYNERLCCAYIICCPVTCSGVVQQGSCWSKQQGAGPGHQALGRSTINQPAYLVLTSQPIQLTYSS